jgi:hypothetical protein
MTAKITYPTQLAKQFRQKGKEEFEAVWAPVTNGVGRL